MAISLSFKDFLKEADLPLVWGKKRMNSVGAADVIASENEEDVLDDIDLDDADLDDLGDDTEVTDDLNLDDDEETEEDQGDPNKQGVIRTIKNAHLVYKRKGSEGDYEELWIYNIYDKINDEMEVRRDILAGTDIPPGKKESKDGSQAFELWSSGNVQFLFITGMVQ